MSKRTRASIRAGAKGRSLRPRISTSVVPSSGSPSSDRVQGSSPTFTASEESFATVVEQRVIESVPPRSGAIGDRVTIPEAPSALKSSPPVEPTPVVIAAEPVVVEPKPVLVDAKPVVVEAKPVVVEAKPVVVEAKPVVVEAKPVVVEAKRDPKADSSAALSQSNPSLRKSSPSNAPKAKKDEQDPSSVSAEFFRAEEDSLPPMIEPHEVDDEQPVRVELSPAMIARRARFRRVVAGVISFAAVISLAVVGKTLAAGKARPEAPKVAMVTEELKAEPQKPEAKPVETTKLTEPMKAEPQEAKKDEAPPAPEAKAAEAKPEEAKPAEAKPEEKKEEAKPAADVEALKKQALSLLNRGKLKDVVDVCDQGIAADPAEAVFYLYRGAALQDLGKAKEARESYNDCVRLGTKGSTADCRAMGGHK